MSYEGSTDRDVADSIRTQCASKRPRRMLLNLFERQDSDLSTMEAIRPSIM